MFIDFCQGRVGLVISDCGFCSINHDFTSTQQLTGFADSSTKQCNPLVEWALSPIKELLFATKECVPLLHQQGYCAMLVIDVGHRHHSWVGLLVVFLLRKPAQHPVVQWKLMLIEGAFRTVPVQGPLDPVSEVYGALSNRNLSATSAPCILS